MQTPSYRVTKKGFAYKGSNFKINGKWVVEETMDNVNGIPAISEIVVFKQADSTKGLEMLPVEICNHFKQNGETYIPSGLHIEVYPTNSLYSQCLQLTK